MKKSILIVIQIFVVLVVSFFSAIPSFGLNYKKIIADNGFKPSVAPMLDTHWSQDGGEDCLLPILEDGSRAKAGCGAVALAQVMNYWKYPYKGTGFNYYVWHRGYNDYEALIANFEDNPFEWDKTINVYKNNDNATQSQLMAIGNIMRGIGIALEMKYSDGGTPTSIETIHTVLKRFFKYNRNSELKWQSNGYSKMEWLVMIYKELSEGRPVIMGGSYYGYNHIYVADGYDEDGMIHLNMGHADINKPNHDKYYDIFNNETYTSDMKMIVGIYPGDLDAFTSEVYIDKNSSIEMAIGDEADINKISRIKIKGFIDKLDISVLRKLSRYNGGQLSYIDMSECEIESGVLPDSAFFDSYALQELIFPKSLKVIGEKSLMNCRGLYRVTLPDDVEEISNYAFSSCRYLNDFTMPKSVVKLGYNPFRYDKIGNFKVAEGNSSYKMVDNFLMSFNRRTLYAAPSNPSGKVSIPDGTQSIYVQAFIMSPLVNSVVVPESVKSISSWAFAHCYFLDDVYCLSKKAPTIKDNTFELANPDAVLHVPEGAIYSYEDNGWDIPFHEIFEDVTNAVSDVCIESDEKVAVFDLLGRIVDSPLSGQIYVIKYRDGSYSKIVF